MAVVSCERPEHSGAAALATVARSHGLLIEPDEIAPLLDLPALTTLADLVVASGLLGYESVPLEGSYDDLAALELPGIVVLRGQPEAMYRFAVLCEFDEAQVVIADPVEGAIRTIARDDFSAAWTGDCLQLVPVAARLADAGERLALHRSLLRRLAHALRFAPPRAPKFLFLAGALGLPLLAGSSLFRGDPLASTIGLLALSVAATSALWQALFGPSCAHCGAAKQLVGALPLDRIGVGFYTLLLVFALAAPSASAPVYILLAAAGAHLWLLGLLYRNRTICRACLVTALAAFTATAMFAHIAAPSPALTAAALATGLAGMAAASRFFRQVAERTTLWEARRIALSALEHRTPDEPGTVRVIVWKKQRCASCLIYEAALKPALLAELGDSIVLDERDAGASQIPVPLILIAGPVPALFLGLPGTDDDFLTLRLAIEHALDPASATLARLGGMLVVSPRGHQP